MTFSAWRKLAILGLLTGVAVAGCVVGTDDDDDDDDIGFGGTAGVGGDDAGVGGSAGSGGGGGFAGAATGGSGGSPTTTFACQVEGGSSTLGNADELDDTGCEGCIKDNCAAEWEACTAFDPENECAFGGPEGNGEFTCFQDCAFERQADGGILTEDDQAECANMCQTPQCPGSTVGEATNGLIGCLNDTSNDCDLECLVR